MDRIELKGGRITTVILYYFILNEVVMPLAKQSPASKQLDSWISFFVIVVFPQMSDYQYSKNWIPTSFLGGSIRLIYILSSTSTFSPQRTHLKGAKTGKLLWRLMLTASPLKSIEFILVYARDWMFVLFQNSYVKVLTPSILTEVRRWGLCEAIGLEAVMRLGPPW